MQAERDHLVRFVFPKLCEELLKHRIHLLDVDLRWGVTSEQDVISACREVIDECHPRFMGLLGGRYGYVAPQHDRSMTADEIHYGVLDRAKMNGTAFFYFRDDQATANIVEEIPGDYRDPDGSVDARKLADLKQTIVSAGLPAFKYGAHWDVQQNRLTGLKPFGDHVFAYLLNNFRNDPELADRFSGGAAGPADEFTEEREAMESFIEARTEQYIVGSRLSLLERLIDFASADSDPNILVIEAPPGSGKSALLGKLSRLLASREHLVVIPHFVGASANSTDLRLTLRRLCHELAVKVANNDPLPDSLLKLIQHFRCLAREVASHRRVVLVLDAINQFDAAESAYNLNWLPKDLPPNVRVIASSSTHPAPNSLFSSDEPIRFERLNSLSDEDSKTIIETFLRRYSKRLSTKQIAALLAKSDSHLPLYLLTALQELRTLGTFDQITDRIEEFPGETKTLFMWILKDRLSNDPGFRNAIGQPCGATIVATFASCLGASRYGLSQMELFALIDPGDPRGNIAALLRLLRPYLMLRNELFDFFHVQLREAVQDEFLKSMDIRRQSHLLLADYFERQVNRSVVGPFQVEIVAPSSRKVVEWPYQLLQAEAWERLEACLVDMMLFLEFRGEDNEGGKIQLGRYWHPLRERGRNMGMCYLKAYISWLGDVNHLPIPGIVDANDTLANELGLFLMENGITSFAEVFLRNALVSREKRLEPDHPDVAGSLQNLGVLLTNTNRGKEAEQLLLRSAAIREGIFKVDDPKLADSYLSLANLRADNERWIEAESLYRKSVAIHETSRGLNHPNLAYSLHGLAVLLTKTNRPAEAEPLFLRAIAIVESSLGADHPIYAGSLDSLAIVYMNTNRFAEAEPLFKRAITIREKSLGPNHPNLAEGLNNLAVLLIKGQRSMEAEPFLRRAIDIWENSDAVHPALAPCLSSLALLLQGANRRSESEKFHRRALAIVSKVKGSGHPLVMDYLEFLALFLATTGRQGEAEPLFRQILANREKHLGLDHRDVAKALHGLSYLFQQTARHVEAEPMLRRALSIYQKTLGADHPNYRAAMSNLIDLLIAANRIDEAESLIQQAIAWIQRIHGPNHPDIAVIRSRLAKLMREKNRG